VVYLRIQFCHEIVSVCNLIICTMSVSSPPFRIICVWITPSRKKTGRLSLNKSETCSLILLSGLLVEQLIILVYYLPFYPLRLAPACTLESLTSRISLVFNSLVGFGVKFVVMGLCHMQMATVVMSALLINRFPFRLILRGFSVLFSFLLNVLFLSFLFRILSLRLVVSEVATLLVTWVTYVT
jgi:hypothetical protein